MVNRLYKQDQDKDLSKSNSVFLTQHSEIADIDDHDSKPTYTTVLNSVPKGSTETAIKDWATTTAYKTEWRWRFLELPNNRRTVEISFVSSDKSPRQYFNKNGLWVVRDVPEVYDQFVTKVKYYYST